MYVSGAVSRHMEVAPRRRVDDRDSPAGRDVGYFFPREIVTLLDLGNIEYHQLRRLLLLVREQAGESPPPGRKWARYTLRDVAALEVLLGLCGGREAVAPGRHLQIAPVARACRALVAQGVRDPLLNVPLRREGTRVLAVVAGTLLDPVTGQVALEDGYERVNAFLAQRQAADAELRRRLLDERAHRQAKPPPEPASGDVVL